MVEILKRTPSGFERLPEQKQKQLLSMIPDGDAPGEHLDGPALLAVQERRAEELVG